jgi:signal peptidase II
VTTVLRATRIALVLTLLIACIGCDQVSKHLVREHLTEGAVHSFFGDTLRVMHAENPGVFLSLGASLPSSVRVWLFQGVIGLLVLGLVWAAACKRGFSRWQIIAFALLAAGGLGNLIDRFSHAGRVTDFLNLGIGGIRTGIFNIADMLGVIAVTILLATRNTESQSNVLRRM